MWYYENKVVDSISQLPEGAFGFVYKITNLENGKFYIGKKQLFSERNVKLGKKELLEIAALKKPGKKPTKKKVIKESDWLKYWGSEEVLKSDIAEKGLSIFKREIIKICFSKKQLTYQEEHLQHKFEVLESDNCYNSNIGGVYFRKDIL